MVKELWITNVVIALLRGEARLLGSFNAASEVILPATAIGELYYGASLGPAGGEPGGSG